MKAEEHGQPIKIIPKSELQLTVQGKQGRQAKDQGEVRSALPLSSATGGESLALPLDNCSAWSYSRPILNTQNLCQLLFP